MVATRGEGGVVNEENGGGRPGWMNYEEKEREREGEKEGEEDRGGGDYTRARERNGRLKRTLNGRENANEADYSQICFEFVYTERRPRCFIFNAAAASRFRGLAALPSPGMMRGYNGRVSGVSSCVVCRSRCINSGESFQSFVANIFERIRKHIWWRKSLFDNLGKYIFGVLAILFLQVSSKKFNK